MSNFFLVKFISQLISQLVYNDKIRRRTQRGPWSRLLLFLLSLIGYIWIILFFWVLFLFSFVFSLHVQLIYSNATLFSRVITNESRAKVSSFEMSFAVSIFTPPLLLKTLEQEMKRYVESRAMDFVKDSFRIIVYEVNPGHCIRVRKKPQISICVWLNHKVIFSLHLRCFI